MTDRMQAIVAKEGEPLKLAEVDRPEIGPHDVLVKVAAAGLNRADLVQRAGKYPPPPGASQIMGLECAGTIVALGEKVTRWKEGDRVCALLAGGGYAEFCAVDEGSLLPVPENLTLTEAAALPEAMMTVYANIFMRSAFKAGENVLIHGGTSGIGRVCSTPGSALCQDSAISKMARPCWMATTRRELKLRPSRLRSTS